MHLTTLGHPALHLADGSSVEGLRRKDLALLVYLCVEGAAKHSRPRLASLLWGQSPEERARHSLTQALGRLVRVLPPGTLIPDKDGVRWAGTLPSDAGQLLRAPPGAEPNVDALYRGHFLEGFDAGAGTEDFRDWADRRRAELRNAALRLLELAGERAEAAGEWEHALRLGERAVQIDPVWERGHRRILRVLAERGERNRALRHYQALEAWLGTEVGGEPDPDTRALADALRAPEPASPPRPSPGPAPFPGDPGPAQPPPSAPAQAPPPAPVHVAPPPPPAPEPVHPSCPNPGPGDRSRRWRDAGVMMVLLLLKALLVALLIAAAVRALNSRDRTGKALPARVEHVACAGRVYGGGAAPG